MSLSAARDTQEHQQPNQDHGHCIICVPVARARIPTIIRRSTLSHNFELIILRRISSTPKSIDHFIYGLHECARLCCRKAGANFFRFTVILLLLLCVRVCATCLRVHSNGTCTVFGFARNQPSVILHALPIHLRFVYTKQNFHRSVFAESESYCFAHFQCNIANRWNEEAAAVIARYERPLQVVFSAFRLVYWFT